MVDIPIKYKSIDHIPIILKEEIDKIINLYNELEHEAFTPIIASQDTDLYLKLCLKIENIIYYYEILIMEKTNINIHFILSS